MSRLAIPFVVLVCVAALVFLIWNGQDKNSGPAKIVTPVAELTIQEPTAVPGSILAEATPTPVPNPTGVSPGDRMIIEKAGVNAPLSFKSVFFDGTTFVMPDPNGADDVVYYDFSQREGTGGAVGQGGNAVFSGHLDWGGSDGTGCQNNTVIPPCPAVFGNLYKVVPGDNIDVVLSGTTYRFRVTTAQGFKLSDVPVEDILTVTDKETITVMTCAGDFNPQSHTYDSIHIVQAERVS